MKVLLIGGGGREHALGWTLARSPRVDRLFSLPGNPGLGEIGALIEGIDPLQVGAVGNLAAQLGVDLVVVGPEGPLAAGVVDELKRRRIPVWGPTRSAARLESSKVFAKEIMDRAGVATATWRAFTDEESAVMYLASIPAPYVIKADGLAAGKGVVVTEDSRAAVEWIRRCCSGGFGEAGKSLLIERFLDGPEVSVFALCSGTDVVALEPARDYKRLLDDDKGPNTGGMGSFSPVDDLPPDLIEHTVEKVIKPVLATMAGDGIAYTGFLYAGLVLTSHGAQVLEFNCRLGDPESQVILPRMSTDLVDLIEAGLGQGLGSASCQWSDLAAVNVVLAAAGYPESPRSGDTITLPIPAEGELIFHAGTARRGSRLVTTGGRVLSAVGIGPDLDSARARAYGMADRIRFQGKQYRHDIGG